MNEQFPFFNKNRRFLVMARVGDSSLHKEWLNQCYSRNFDLFLEYFGDGSNDYRNDCDFYSEAKDRKWPRLYKLMEVLSDNILKYDAVWFPDDDISINCHNINEMFQIFMEYELSLAQPGLTEDSYWSHYITLANNNYILRYTNFVEVMAPVFSREALKFCWPTFKKCQSGWGLDSVWPKILGYPYNKIAIIDQTPMRHTRPIGHGELYVDIGCSPEEERSKIEAEYGVTNAYDFKVYNTVLKNSRKTKRQSNNIFFKSKYK